MKKILLAAVLMLSSVAAFAQHEVGTFTLQPKVGVNLATLTGSDVNNAKVRPAFVAGVEGEYQIADIFSLSLGALYSQQGAKSKEDPELGKMTVQMDYINVPVLANVYVAPGFAVKLGVQAGFNIRHKAKLAGHTFDLDDIAVLTDDAVSTNKVDLSIPVGVSYEYSNVVLDARYNWGLTKMFKNLKSYNSVFQITVGYKFEL